MGNCAERGRAVGGGDGVEGTSCGDGRKWGEALISSSPPAVRSFMRIVMVKMKCEREDWMFIFVAEMCRCFFACRSSFGGR